MNDTQNEAIRQLVKNRAALQEELHIFISNKISEFQKENHIGIESVRVCLLDITTSEDAWMRVTMVSSVEVQMIL